MLSQAGAHIVMSQHGCRETNCGAGTRFGNKVPLVKWPRPQRPKWMDAETYNGLPDYLQVREIEVDARVLVTTLQDAKAVSPQEIDALYAMRWNIEVDFRTLKATMAMDVLPHRPHRVEPRAKKRRPKPLPLLTTTRALARRLIMDQRTLKVVP